MDSIITQLTVTENVTLITLHHIPFDIGEIAGIFQAIGDANLNIDMISQTVPYKGIVSLSFTLPDDDLFTAIQTLKKFKSHIPSLRMEINSGNVKLSIFGEAMKHTPGTAAKTMSLLAGARIEIQLITTSEMDISYLIYASDKNRAVRCIKEFFPSI